MGIGYCLTINNWTADDLDDFFRARTSLDYFVAGFEVAPSTSTPHLQAFISVKTRSNFVFIKRLFPRAHIEVCSGSYKNAVHYCKKDGLFVEWPSACRKSMLPILDENAWSSVSNSYDEDEHQNR